MELDAHAKRCLVQNIASYILKNRFGPSFRSD
jgi:hypothetical protein